MENVPCSTTAKVSPMRDQTLPWFQCDRSRANESHVNATTARNTVSSLRCGTFCTNFSGRLAQGGGAGLIERLLLDLILSLEVVDLRLHLVGVHLRLGVFALLLHVV